MANVTTSGIRNAPLTADEIIAYSERGFVVPGRIFDDRQVERMCAALDRCRKDEHMAGREYNLLDPLDSSVQGSGTDQQQGKSVGFLFNLYRIDDVFRDAVFNPVLARWATQLLGARQVRLLEDGAIYKEPKTGGSLNWHQDYPYWPLAQPTAVTAWIALDNVTIENGCVNMAVGSHLLGERLPADFGTGQAYMSDHRYQTVKPIDDPEKIGLQIEPVVLGPGEVSLHHALTWHGSGPNVSDRPRRAFVPRYVSDGVIWLGSRRYAYNYTDEEVGIAIGEPLGGKYFPLVPYETSE
jgi:hypothetical protein